MNDAAKDVTEIDGAEHTPTPGVDDEAAPRAVRPEFGDPENWHDLAERGTPRNG